LEQELKSYIHNLKDAYPLKEISAVLFSQIREFLLRKGKRIRPILCVLGYLGYTRKIQPGLWRTALSLELLHDFMLVHDDIIDKSDTRRGKLSMHTQLNRYLANFKKPKCTGEDLTIVIGDVMFSLALDAFLAIQEESARKEQALKKLIEAALYTGSGEFIELVAGLKEIAAFQKKTIYQIYDLKTARYTFSYPLAIGATLAGANKNQTDKLIQYGICVGRAFQIQDDICGMFSSPTEIGKSNLADLKEAKKTLLILQAYKYSGKTQQQQIRRLLAKKDAGRGDLLKMRRIIRDSGALDYARKEIAILLAQAEQILADTQMQQRYKTSLASYIRQIIRG
jgi:geranylgeranyl diphosphate synthase type I